jgi:hypothetical protein
LDALWLIQPEYTPYRYSANDPINKKDPSGYQMETLKGVGWTKTEEILDDFNNHTGGGAGYQGIVVTYHASYEIREANPLEPGLWSKPYYTYSDGMSGRTSSLSPSETKSGRGQSWNGDPSQFVNTNITLTTGGPPKKASPNAHETKEQNLSVNTQMRQSAILGNGGGTTPGTTDYKPSWTNIEYGAGGGGGAGGAAIGVGGFVRVLINFALDVFGLGNTLNSEKVYSPPTPLDRDKDGNPAPSSPYPHTQLGTRQSKKRPGTSYPQAREFDGSGKPVKDIDWTDHGRPQNHPNPHEHKYNPETGKRGPAQPLNSGIPGMNTPRLLNPGDSPI